MKITVSKAADEKSVLVRQMGREFIYIHMHITATDDCHWCQHENTTHKMERNLRMTNAYLLDGYRHRMVGMSNLTDEVKRY